MANVALVTADAGGNVAPFLGLATELMARGHSVRVFSHEAQAMSVFTSRADFIPYKRSPEWAPREPQGTLPGLKRFIGLFASYEIGDEVVAELRENPADIVVVDCMLFGVMARLGRAGVKYSVLFHSFFAYFEGQFRYGPVGIVCRLKGLNAQSLWDAGESRIVCTDRELDPYHGAHPAIWTGPIHATTEAAQRPKTPRILVSLSTISYPGMQAVYQRVLDAAAESDSDFVVTTGPALSVDQISAPPNATVHQYLSHNEVMETCSAVICHGGHATTMRALSFSLPVIVIPMHPLLDQLMVGKALERAGAGILLGKSAKPSEINGALDRLFTDPKYLSGASELGERFRAEPGSLVAVAEIERLLS